MINSEYPSIYCGKNLPVMVSMKWNVIYQF
jgi:hypothetical protein